MYGLRKRKMKEEMMRISGAAWRLLNKDKRVYFNINNELN